MRGTCGDKSAETLSKTSCCCGADEANPCACMKAPEPMNCSATEPKCQCYKDLEKNAETYEAKVYDSMMQKKIDQNECTHLFEDGEDAWNLLYSDIDRNEFSYVYATVKCEICGQERYGSWGINEREGFEIVKGEEGRMPKMYGFYGAEETPKMETPKIDIDDLNKVADAFKSSGLRVTLRLEEMHERDYISILIGLDAPDQKIKSVRAIMKNLGYSNWYAEGKKMYAIYGNSHSKLDYTEIKVNGGHQHYRAETFEATVIRQGKAPKGAMAKAMMNQSMMEQANIEAMIQELENKVNLGLISEDDLMASLKKKFGAEYDIEVYSSEEFSKEDLEAYFADLKRDNPKLAKIIEFKIKNEEYLPKKLIESSGYDYEILEAWNDYVIDDDKYALFDPCPACEGEGWIMTSYTPATRFEPADGDGEVCGECGGSGKIDPSDYMYYDDKGEIEYAAETKKRNNEYEEYLKHKDEMLRQCDRAIDDFTSRAKRYSEEGEYGMAKMLRSDATDMKKLKRMIEKNHFGKATHFAMGMDSQPRDMAPSALWLFDAEN